MTCQDIREDVAVALLTREPLDDDAAGHLATCELCARVHDELAALPGLLSLVPAPLPVVEDAGELLARLLDAVVAERRRRRLRTTLVGVAAAVVLVGAGAVVAHRADVPGPLPSPVESTPTVLADVTLHPVSATTTRVDVAVTGLAADTDCTVSAVTADGRRYPVVTWTVGYAGTGHAQGTAPVASSDVVRVELTDAASGALITSVDTKA